MQSLSEHLAERLSAFDPRIYGISQVFSFRLHSLGYFGVWLDIRNSATAGGEWRSGFTDVGGKSYDRLYDQLMVERKDYVDSCVHFHRVAFQQGW